MKGGPIFKEQKATFRKLEGRLELRGKGEGLSEGGEREEAIREAESTSRRTSYTIAVQ